MLSTEGPGLVVADFNHDSLDYLLAARRDWGKVSFVSLQQKSGKFLKTVQPGLETDTTLEFVASCVADINNDTDSLIWSWPTAGHEFYGSDEQLRPRFILNDGKGILRVTKQHSTAFL